MALWRVTKKDVVFYTIEVEADTEEEAEMESDDIDGGCYDMEPSGWGWETVRIEKVED